MMYRTPIINVAEIEVDAFPLASSSRISSRGCLSLGKVVHDELLGVGLLAPVPDDGAGALDNLQKHTPSMT
jgi:hypothetical protein